MTVATIHPGAVTSDRRFQPLKDYVIAKTGLVYYADRNEEFARYVARRLQVLGLDNCVSYLEVLQNGDRGDDELDQLIEALTIGETFFFRHAELFQALEHTVLPDLIQRNQHRRRLRIWSAGCSVGAEAYSLSILLRRQLAARVPDWEITILGTDINRDFLARATRGQFEAWALRGMPDADRQVCFLRDGNRWTIQPRFRAGVSFQYHNLASHPFPSLLHDLTAFDLILCRNVMIYFAPVEIGNIVNKFYQCLVDGGWLLVGHAEHNADWFAKYRTVMAAGAVCYQKVEHATESVSRPPTFTVARAFPQIPANLPVPSATGGAVCRTENTDPAAGKPRPVRHDRYVSASDEHRRANERSSISPTELARIRELADRGELEAARSHCCQLLDTHQLDPTAHFYRALIAEQLGERDIAKQSLSRAIYLDRNYVLAHYYLGLISQKHGAQAQAIRSFQNVARLLTPREPTERIPHSDDLTVDDLKKLAVAHLTAWQQL